MKDMNTSKNDNDFKALYEASFSGMTTYRPGQVVETQVLSIGKDSIFIALNGKSEGVLDRSEFTDKEGDLTISEGDAVKVFFLEAKNGEMRFTTKLAGEKAAPGMVEQAYHNQIPVEGVVEKEIKGGYEVKIGEARAFCPFSQMGQKRTENPADWIGKTLTFRIMEYKEGGRNILVSNRVFFEEARKENLEVLKDTLKENMVVKGVVQSLQKFGAFLDIGGVQGLLPLSEVGRSRIDDIQKVLSVGQELEVKIIKLEWASNRITLSLKSMEADPWDKVSSKYPVGSKHQGKVARTADFGAFVTLEPGIDGLIHISELRGDSKFGGNEVSLKAGQTLAVAILAVDAQNKRISLKPAASAEEDAATEKYMSLSDQGDTYNPFANLKKK